MVAAVDWIDQNVDRSATVVVDDSLWLDLVQLGFDAETGVVWYPKLDLDPAVQELIGGWESVDYVVSTPVIRDTGDELPLLRAAMGSARRVAGWDEGSTRIEILEVDETDEDR